MTNDIIQYTVLGTPTNYEPISFCGYVGIMVKMPDGNYQRMPDIYVRGCLD